MSVFQPYLQARRATGIVGLDVINIRGLKNMSRRCARLSEILGIGCLLASVAIQMFYLDPLQRNMDWRRAMFAIQQVGHVQAQTAYDNQLVLLNAMNAPAERIEAAGKAKATTIDKYQTADANVADYILAKEPVEQALQWIVLGLFAIGTLLTGLGKLSEARRLRN